jgi:protein SCO1/2
MTRIQPAFAVFTAAVLLAAAPALRAQTADERTPRELEGVGIQEHLGAKIDLSLTFIGEDGYPHPLGEYFQKGRPVILNLVYFTCPMLCTLVLNGQTEALRKLPQTIGKDFDVVTISIDPRDDYGMARAKKAAYLESYERPTGGWHFLIDHEGNVKKLAEQIGFHYRFDPQIQQFAHAAAIFVLSPEGMVSRYLYGVKFKPLDIRLALTEAAGEKYGVSEKVLLYCFHYDPVARSYVPFAQNFMRTGGLLALVVFGFVLFRLWRRERRISFAKRHMVTAK